MKILVVEDAGPDRRRFRILLDDALRHLKANEAEGRIDNDIDYDFAWDSKEKRVLWQMENANSVEIRDYINKYDHMFLDLAWTKYEEDLMNRARRQSKKWLFENAEHWSEQAKIEMGAIPLREEGLVRNISGFALLDMLKEGEKLKTKVTVTTGFYSEAVAHFCAERWSATVFYKWEDEDKIGAFILQAYNRGTQI
jgi:hypothetical protein